MDVKLEPIGPQEKWEQTFAKLDRSAPAPRADESDLQYLRRLSRVGRNYIPAGEEIAQVAFDRSLPDAVVPKYSEMMRAAVERNLYRTDNMAPGEMRPVLETDPTPARKYARGSAPTHSSKR